MFVGIIMSGTLANCYYILHLSGLISLLIALYVSLCKLLMCLHVSLCVLYWHLGLFVMVYMYFWSFIHVCFVGTQCGFFPLCVAHFLFVTALLLMQYSVPCVLCNSYILSMTMSILIILVPFSL